MVRECQWALKRKQNTLEAAAHLRLVIFVSLRMAASAVAPSAPIILRQRLRARSRMGNSERVGVSRGADKKGIGAAAHLSEVTELPLSPSQSTVKPSAV